MSFVLKKFNIVRDNHIKLSKNDQKNMQVTIQKLKQLNYLLELVQSCLFISNPKSEILQF